MTHRPTTAEGPVSRRSATAGLPMFDDPPDGAAQKEAALTSLATKHAVVLAQLRAAMLALFRERERTWPRGTAYVTSDNVAVWHDLHGHPLVEGRGCYGAVFKAKGWQQVGWTKSDPHARPGNKSADLRKWAWRGD